MTLKPAAENKNKNLVYINLMKYLTVIHQIVLCPNDRALLER